MLIDKTTLNDLSIFHHEEEQSVFHHLNFTTCNEGREYLKQILSKPLDNIDSIKDTQKTIAKLGSIVNKWPAIITNGTVMVIDRFYDTAVDNYPARPSLINSYTYKVISGSDYSLTRYSVEHFIGFIHGIKQLSELLHETDSQQLQTIVGKMKLILNKPFVKTILTKKPKQILSSVEVLTLGNTLKNNFKHDAFELIEIYGKLDAYLSLAKASIKNNFCFPSFVESEEPLINAKGLYHLLLNVPVSYDINFNQQHNFLFLTGANMAGKSTFIKAMGTSVYLAHIGMGIPAKSMELSLFNGILSNIQVEDNILKGESFFFNEVQRIKNTIEKISDGKKWFILIDELFKGTNVQDAMKCSTSVIEGLRKMNNALFILSTHLYEIGEALKRYPNIQFRFFESAVANDQLIFSYHLKEGISNDRLGYLILKKEGVVDLLNKL